MKPIISEAEAAFVADSEILLGTHLLRDYQLQVNFVTRTVEKGKRAIRFFLTKARKDGILFINSN